MAKPKKLLILYATAGSGHKKAAEALAHATGSQDADVQVQLVDIVTFLPAPLRWLYVTGYTWIIRFAPKLWGALYLISDTPRLRWCNDWLRRFLNVSTCGRLIRYLKQNQPDAVLSTHFLASEIVAYTKRARALKAKLVSVITDFDVHSFWLHRETDIYCCASDHTRRMLLLKGIGPEKIKVTGIPVHEKFLSLPAKKDLLEGFSLKCGRFSVLVVTGGIGAGPIERIVDVLKDEVQLLVVCGHNKALSRRLKKRNDPAVRVFGFVDTMEKLMGAADLAVTKAGWLSVSECLTTGLPAVFFHLIPGQELKNALTVESKGAGLIARTPQDIREAVLRLKTNRKLLSQKKEAALRLAKPHAARSILDLVL